MNTKKNNSLVPFIAVVAVLVILIASTFAMIRDSLNLGLDLVGGFEILYEVTPLEEEKADSVIDMNAVTNSIQKRVNVLGVSEPMITVEGANRVRVQLAGITDQESAREMIGTTANLTFRDVNDELLSDSSIITEGGASLAYQDGRPIVSLKIADQSKFAEITSDVSSRTSGNNIMIIWLDWEEGDSYKEEYSKSLTGKEPKYISAASVRGTINGDCIIEGNFTDTEARTLAELINSGSLPVKMSEISSNVVSAQYGANALRRTALAGFVGILLVIAFMVYKYRLPGIVSIIMLGGYIWAVFGIYGMMGAVFTLTAIGALVLGVGMTVDANIISYERIRQELFAGRSVRGAVAEGQKQSFSAIFDAQLTTLIAGLIMYIWGNGAVRGFATMLIITVVCTLVINVAFSRWLLNQLVGSGKFDDKPEYFGVKKNQIPDISKGESQFYYGVRGIDYIKNAKYLIFTSLAILGCALLLGGFNAVNGRGFMNLGIDFAAGTKLTVTSDHPITINEVSTRLSDLGYSGFSYQAAGDSTVYATTKQPLTTDQLKEIKKSFTEEYGQEPGDNVVTPIVGRELVRNAVILTVVAWIAMLAYIAFRYEWDYAVSCLVALVHDVLITLAMFVILRLEVNTEVISVLLTIIGYSINNSIVVFDRVRETVADSKSKPDYKKIVNDALDKTLLVSLFSSLTTLLPVIMLLILGSRSIFTFTFAMLTGMIAGTFSSIFVAPRLWCWIRQTYKPKSTKKVKKKAEKESLDEYTIKGINA